MGVGQSRYLAPRFGAPILDDEDVRCCVDPRARSGGQYGIRSGGRRVQRVCAPVAGVIESPRSVDE
jgi:hypothetical protein